MLAFTLTSISQKIIYSQPDKDDAKNLNYEIMGKADGNILVYKNYRDFNFISIYDANMAMIEKVKLDYLPDGILNADFLQYPNQFFMFYQYAKRGITYNMATRLDNKGKLIGNPVELDTADITLEADNKVYSVINSENKQYIMVVLINAKSDKIDYVKTTLYDRDLNLIHRTKLVVKKANRNDFLSSFQLDNEGNLLCIKASSSSFQYDNINKIAMLIKAPMADTCSVVEVKTNNVYLDNINVKVDNYNKHYFISAFYSKQRRGSIDGLLSYIWDAAAKKELIALTSPFSEELRNEARGEASTKTAFDDYFIRNVVMKKDGGFVIGAESVSTSSRGNSLSRWDYGYGSPYMNYGNSYYPWNRFNSVNTITRYFADNIAIMSYDANGKIEWSNVITKSQYDDNSDTYISYGVINMGDKVKFLFNLQEKRDMVLTEQNLTPAGKLERVPTLKSLDLGYDFIPRQLKQVGAKQVIIPCMYKNYICFAKVDF